MPRNGWKSISISEEMVEKIEKLINERPDLGFTSVSAFVTDAVRRLFETCLPLEHFNVYEDHVTIVDHTKKGLANVYFRDKTIYCELCDESKCEHIEYALNLPKVLQILKDKGWIIKEGKIIRGPF